MIEKLYYGIEEVSKQFNVPQSMIRYWLAEFKITIKKRRRNFMFFNPKEVETIGEIYYLLKVRKFTIEGAIREIQKWEYIHDIQAMLRVG